MFGICQVDYEEVTEGELCRCGGKIDIPFSLDDPTSDIWRGRCFVCHRLFLVIRLGDNGG